MVLWMAWESDLVPGDRNRYMHVCIYFQNYALVRWKTHDHSLSWNVIPSRCSYIRITEAVSSMFFSYGDLLVYIIYWPQTVIHFVPPTMSTLASALGNGRVFRLRRWLISSLHEDEGNHAVDNICQWSLRTRALFNDTFVFHLINRLVDNTLGSILYGWQ